MRQLRPKIVLPGGVGYLGRALAEHLGPAHEVVVLSRHPAPATEHARFVVWDGETLGDWAQELDGARAVVNLAGRSVNCRYNERNKREIFESRVRSTQTVGEAISRCENPPPVWINASTATFYRDARNRAMDESTGEAGEGFSVDVGQQWEAALNEAVTPRTRKVALRLAMVFGAGRGGVWEAFERIVKMGLGGSMGGGQQWVSWLHIGDFCRSVEWIIEHPELEGAVNCCAPHPLPNREFLRELRWALHRPFGLRTTPWMLKIGALALGTETELLLKSRRVVPTKLQASGFAWQFSRWREAVRDITAS